MPRESPSFHAMSVLMAGDAADSLEDRRIARIARATRKSHGLLFWMLYSIDQQRTYIASSTHLEDNCRKECRDFHLSSKLKTGIPYSINNLLLNY